MITGVISPGGDTKVEENMGPIHYKRATLCRPRNVLTYARFKVAAAQGQYKIGFDRKENTGPIINPGDFLYVHRPPRALTKAKQPDRRHSDEDTTDTSPEVLPRSEEPYFERLGTRTVARSARNDEITTMSTDRVT